MRPQDLPLFEHWYRTTNWILERSEKFPKHTRFTISSRINTLALEITEDIVTAIYSRDKRSCLERINMRLEILRIMFRISHERRYISHDQYEFISKAINESGKMTGGWLKSISH